MPKVHFVKSSRKARPEIAVEVGDSYYWWSIKTGPASSRRYESKSAPKRSQLTTSDYFGQLWDIQDDNNFAEHDNFSDLESMRDDVVSRLQDLADTQEERKSNMPEALQESDTGQMLQERYDNVMEGVSNLEGVSIESDDEAKAEIKEQIISRRKNGDQSPELTEDEEKDVESEYEQRVQDTAQELNDALQDIN